MKNVASKRIPTISMRLNRCHCGLSKSTREPTRTVAKTLNGTLNRNNHSQDRVSLIQPPRLGPSATAPVPSRETMALSTF